MKYLAPNLSGSLVEFKTQYQNFIGGEWCNPCDGKYFEALCPVNGKPYTLIPRSNENDIELALDKAHAAAKTWGKTSVTERANCLFKIADSTRNKI